MKNLMFIGVVLALFVFAGCTNTDGPASADEEVFTIGVILPLTGDGAVYGAPLQKVSDKAFSDLNELWAEKGMRLKPIFEDGKCNGKEGLTAAQKLVNIDGVKIIHGGACSGETLGAAPFTESNGVLLFSSVSSSPDVTNAGDLVFRNYPSDTAQVRVMTDFIVDMGYTSVALLSENTDYAQALRMGYKELLPAAGVEIVADEVVNSDRRDVRTEVAKILAAEPEVVMVLPQTIPVAGIFVKQLYESDMKAQGMGNEVFGLDDTLSQYPTESEGFYSPEVYFENGDSEEFLALANETGCELGYYCAAQYDGVFLIAELIETCGGEDTTCMKKYLDDLEGWTGLGGSITFDENGDVPGQFRIRQVVDGVAVPLE